MRHPLPVRLNIGAQQRRQRPLLYARTNPRALHSHLLTWQVLHRCVPRHFVGTQRDAVAPSLSLAAGRVLGTLDTAWHITLARSRAPPSVAPQQSSLPAACRPLLWRDNG